MRGAVTTDTLEPPREVEVQTSYQPSRSELDEDMRVEATLREAVQALARPSRFPAFRVPSRAGERQVAPDSAVFTGARSRRSRARPGDAGTRG